MNIIQFIILLKYILLINKRHGVIYQSLIQHTVLSEQVRSIWQLIRCIIEHSASFGKSEHQCDYPYGLNWTGYVIL